MSIRKSRTVKLTDEEWQEVYELAKALGLSPARGRNAAILMAVRHFKKIVDRRNEP